MRPIRSTLSTVPFTRRPYGCPPGYSSASVSSTARRASEDLLGFWADEARRTGCTAPVIVARNTPGAFLLRFATATLPGHVVICDGKGGTLEAHSHVDGVIRGVFPVNVPYMLPAFPWWPPDQFFKVLVGKDGGETVVFRPREWRGIDDDTDVFMFTADVFGQRQLMDLLTPDAADASKPRGMPAQ